MAHRLPEVFMKKLVGGKRIEELLARIEPARGGPDPNDGKISRDWREFDPR